MLSEGIVTPNGTLGALPVAVLDVVGGMAALSEVFEDTEELLERFGDVDVVAG